MSNVRRDSTAQPKQGFPWLVLFLLIGALYAFWILPMQMGPRHVRVQYESSPSQR